MLENVLIGPNLTYNLGFTFRGVTRTLPHKTLAESLCLLMLKQILGICPRLFSIFGIGCDHFSLFALGFTGQRIKIMLECCRIFHDPYTLKTKVTKLNYIIEYLGYGHFRLSDSVFIGQRIKIMVKCGCIFHDPYTLIIRVSRLSKNQVSCVHSRTLKKSKYFEKQLASSSLNNHPRISSCKYVNFIVCIYIGLKRQNSQIVFHDSKMSFKT